MRLTNISRVVVLGLALFFAVVIILGAFQTNVSSIAGLLKDGGFLQALIFSLQSSIIATVFAFILGVPSGYFLARNNTLLSRILDVLFDIPIVIPPLIVGVLLMSFFNSELIKGLFSFIFTLQGAIIAQFFVAVPFTIKSSKNSFELVSPVYERIAMTLGAKPVKSFFDTTFTIAFPGILSGLILTWLRCIGEFGATIMVAGGIPGKTENIPIHVYLNMISGDFEKGIAASVFAIVIAFFCILFINLLFLKKKSF